MAEHAFDDKEMTGHFLPEDSRLLLKQLSEHIQFLARLAQPRMAAEAKESAPPVGVAELMSRLDQLAGQLELVLREVSWPKQPGPTQASRDTPAATNEDIDEAGDEDADEESEDAHAYAYAAEASDQPLVFGVTMDQIDTLNLLVSRIKAYGDVVFADMTADFAAGTLAMLGHAIFDQAVEVDDILKAINMQTLERSARRSVVEEPQAAYDVQTSRGGARVPHAVPAMAWPALPGSSASLGRQSVH